MTASIVPDIEVAIIVCLIIAALIFRKKIWKAIVEVVMDFLIMLVLFIASQMLVYVLNLSVLLIIPAAFMTFLFWRIKWIKPKDLIIVVFFFAYVIVSLVWAPVSLGTLIVFIAGMIALAVINILGINSEEAEALMQVTKQ